MRSSVGLTLTLSGLCDGPSQGWAGQKGGEERGEEDQSLSSDLRRVRRSRCVVHSRLMEYEDIAKQVLASPQMSICSLGVSFFESPWFNILGWFGCNKYSSRRHQEWWTTLWVRNL